MILTRLAIAVSRADWIRVVSSFAPRSSKDGGIASWARAGKAQTKGARRNERRTRNILGCDANIFDIGITASFHGDSTTEMWRMGGDRWPSRDRHRAQPGAFGPRLWQTRGSDHRRYRGNAMFNIQHHERIASTNHESRRLAASVAPPATP